MNDWIISQEDWQFLLQSLPWTILISAILAWVFRAKPARYWYRIIPRLALLINFGIWLGWKLRHFM
jgi:hypothetical protein